MEESITKEEIIEGNKLIANFMKDEYVSSSDGWIYPINDFRSYRSWRTSELKYFTSWEWLMLVINKIHDLEEEYPVVKNNFHIWILKRHVRFIYYYDDYCIRAEEIKNDEVFKKFQDSFKDYRYCIFDESPIFATWQGIVDFIKWFQNKESSNDK